MSRADVLELFAVVTSWPPRAIAFDPRIAVTLVCLGLVAAVALSHYVRRMIHGWWMAFCGGKDAKTLAERDADVVLLAVSSRLFVTKRRVEAWMQARKKQWDRRAERYANRYLRWRKEYADAQAALTEAVALAEYERAKLGYPPRRPSRPTSARANYIALQALITVLDVIMTYLSLEILLLPPVALVPMSIGFGALGAALGHAAGQSLQTDERKKIGASFAAALIYCGVLGSMRFAYVLATGMAGIPPAIDAIIAFGFPLMLVGASIISGWKFEPLTPLERALLREARAKRNFESAYQRGEKHANILVNRMTEAREHGKSLIDSYQRGFFRLWTGRPFTIPTVYPVVPSMVLWPPVMPSAQSLVAEEPTIDTSSRPSVTVGL